MKKLALLALAGMTVIACKNEPKKDYMVLSGKIDNLNKKELNLVGFDFNKKIKVNDDGTFADTLRIKTGYYNLYGGKKRVSLFLNDTKDFSVAYDTKDTLNTFTFTGSNKAINDYLLAKVKINKELGSVPELFAKKEADFLAALNGVKDKMAELAKAGNLDQSFVDIELKKLNYNFMKNTSRYQNYHGYFSKNRDFKVSETFPKIENLDVNNEQDYIHSSAYRDLVRDKFSKMAADESKKNEGSDYVINFMEAAKANTTNALIANHLLYGNAQNGITYTENLPEFYKKFMEYSSNDDHKKEITKAYNKLKKTAKGQPSPKFANYENYKGGTTSLDDLKGKYVYIDVWATWCGPCKAEIPSLKKVEKQYHGKNIQFVSISIDNKKDHEKWKQMIKDKELGGVQLFADKDWESKFIQDYSIKGIPRFILINPEGVIVSSNAPRPSNPKLIELFKELNI